MKFLSAAVALFLLASSTAAALNVDNCGSDGDTFKLTSLTLSTNQPQADQKLCATLKGTLTKDIINGAKVHVHADVTSPFDTTVDEDLDLCSSLQNGCPVYATTANSAEKTELTYCKTLPFTGFTANVKATATNKDGSSIFCFKGTVTV
ncbi:unnamed protein product [Mortierella alpina]